MVMGMGLMMGLLSWIIQVGPVLLHMSYEVEERGRIEMRLQKKKSQRNVKLLVLKIVEGDQRILEFFRCWKPQGNRSPSVSRREHSSDIILI